MRIPNKCTIHTHSLSGKDANETLTKKVKFRYVENEIVPGDLSAARRFNIYRLVAEANKGGRLTVF